MLKKLIIKIPHDIYTKKRIIYGGIIYTGYIMIFALSYMVSNVFTYSFGAFPHPDLNVFYQSLLFVIVIKFFIFNFFNFKRFPLYSSELYDIIKTFIMVIFSAIVIIVFRFGNNILNEIPILVLILDTVISFSAIVFFNSIFRYCYRNRRNILSKFNLNRNEDDSCNTLIIGDGNTAQILSISLRNSTYNVVGFMSDNPKKISLQLQGRKIYGPIDDIVNISKKKNIHHIIIAHHNGSMNHKKRIVEMIKDTDIKISTVPSYAEIISGNVKVDNIRHIKIEELLRRDKIEIDMDLIYKEISGKNVLVTGAAGSIGSEICRCILGFKPKTLIALDQAETPLFYLTEEFKKYENKTNFIPIIADIVNNDSLESVFKKYRPNVVLHAAAYKHVPMMETNYTESILNNVKGTKNLADIAENYSVDHFVMISTDKAVNPTSIMGMTKRVAEIYIQAFNKIAKTKFITVRFGNVLDSGGNVVEIFNKQIANGEPVTVTHPEMKRYFMLTSEAVQLVLQAGMSGKGGEIFMLDMGEPMNIVDLAKLMIKISGYKVGEDIKIQYTGLRPGEKLFEELQYDDENYCPTTNEKIFAYKCRKNEWNNTKRKIKELIDNVYNYEIEKIIINDLVPEYQKHDVNANVQNDNAIII